MRITFHNELFWEIEKGRSAIRPHTKDRIKVMTIEKDGTIVVKSHTVKPNMRAAIESSFGRFCV